MACYRILQSNNIFEVFKYDKMINIDKCRDGGRKIKDENYKVNIERVNEYKERVNYKARKHIMRLTLCNFDNNNKFVTVTFAENLEDIDQANYEFKKFIQRVKYRQKDFKFIAVIEFQKRGAVHYHMICNISDALLPGVDAHEREREFQSKLWKHGYTKIVNINHVDNVGAYLIKYMSKNMIDSRLNDRKRYFHSKGLIDSTIIEGPGVLPTLEALENYYPTYTSNYYSDFQGEVKYTQYNILKGFKGGVND